MAPPNSESALLESGELELSLIKPRSPVSPLVRIKGLLKYLGPAFVVSVAYIDPGNFGTNISGGAKFNYALIWVILWSNLMAIFLQTLSAKLGIATGRNLPQMCAQIFPRKVNWILWAIAEIAAMATDLAEFLGGTLGIYLLFDIPLIYAGLITGVVTLVITSMAKYGQRVIEAIIFSFVAVVCGAYFMELFLAKPDWSAVAFHTVVPSLPGGEAVLIAVGMLGATVMPHVIYLHSELVQYRNGAHSERKKLAHYRLEKIDITVAMNIAFIINAAIVIVSAAVFFSQGIVVESIEEAHQSLAPLLGSMSSAAFAVALLASGLSSSAVGTMAGQTIMQGFLDLKIPPVLMRLVTMAPAIVIIAMNVNPIDALVISQVILSFALPAAIVPLMLITRRQDLMGKLVNRPTVNYIGWTITSVIIGLNALLLYLTFTGNV